MSSLRSTVCPLRPFERRPLRAAGRPATLFHEGGRFQGRLGFTKAFVVLEEGYLEFNNIEGLGQIRFPKGDIEPALEEIRRILEREELIE